MKDLLVHLKYDTRSNVHVSVEQILNKVFAISDRIIWCGGKTIDTFLYFRNEISADNLLLPQFQRYINLNIVLAVIQRLMLSPRPLYSTINEYH